MKTWSGELQIISHMESLSEQDVDLFLLELEQRQPDLAKKVRLMRKTPSAFLEQPALQQLGCQMGESLQRELARIEGLTIQRSLGQGGMGQVFLALQEGDVSRLMALKVMTISWRPEVQQRFEREYRAHARMSHHHIAQLLNLGFTPETHLPYILMEYVDGRDIVSYCNVEQLSLDERLQLFLQLCEGVSHAHQRGVIHRDLKPGNVLVALDKGRPMVKIIDFGIAKAMDTTDGDALFETAVGTRVGTPAYMSPEQIEGRPGAVDTRTDVYGLGAVLYQMLTGQPPFGSELLQDHSVTDLITLIGTRQPKSPSKLNLALAIPKDLDLIVLKAMAKVQSDRYSTVVELAADIERLRSRQPVLARKGNGWYRLSRFVMRHRASVAVGSFLMLLALFFVAVLLLQQQRTMTALTAQKQTLYFLEEVMVQGDPRLRGREVTFLEALEAGHRKVLNGEVLPWVGYNFTRIYAKALGSNGRHREAYALIHDILPCMEDEPGDQQRELIALLESLALTCSRMNLNAEAETVYLRILDNDALTGNQTAYSKRGLALLYREREPEFALDLLNEAVESMLAAGLMSDVMVSLTGEVDVYRNLGQKNLADNLIQQVQDWQRANLGWTASQTMQTRLSNRKQHKESFLSELQEDARLLVGKESSLYIRVSVALNLQRPDVEECGELANRARTLFGENDELVLSLEGVIARRGFDGHSLAGEIKVVLYEDLLRRRLLHPGTRALLHTNIINLCDQLKQVRPLEAVARLKDLQQTPGLNERLHYLASITLAEAYVLLGDSNEARHTLEDLCLWGEKPAELEQSFFQAAQRMLVTLGGTPP